MITVFVFKNHPVTVSERVAAKKKTKHPVENNPRVRFTYPSKEWPWRGERNVRLIAADGKYLIGLDMGDKNRFKKFRRDRVAGLELVEFNSDALA